MTSSSDCERRFFFFIEEPGSELDVVALEASEFPVDTMPLLVLTAFPLFVVAIRPFECAPPVDVESPFWVLFRQDSSESCPCPAPFACMLLMLMLVIVYGLKQMVDTEGLGEKVESSESSTRTAERPAVPLGSPVSPAPSATDKRCFFRGGGEAPPVSESEEEEAEARVISPGTSATRRLWFGCSMEWQSHRNLAR